MKKLFALIMFTIFTNAAHASLEVNVPFSPGGAVDIIGRDLAEYLKKNGFENFVSNIPGGSGDVAFKHMMNKKDNIIMVSGHGPIVFTNLEQKRENIYTKNTFMIGPILSVPQGFLSSLEGFKNLEELVNAAKSSELPCAISNSQGTAELKKFNALHGTKFVPVPYKGSADLRNDLLGNHIKCAYDTLSSHYTIVKSNKLRMVGITQAEKDFENVPLVTTKLPSGTSVSWYAIVIPKDSNLLQNQKLLDAIREFTKDPKVLSVMKEKGFSPSNVNKDFNKFIDELMKNYSPYF